MLMAGVVSITGHALAVTQFLRAGGRDAWLSGIAAFPLGIVAIWALDRLGRIFPGQTIVQYLPRVLGFLGYPVAAAYLLYFLFVAIFTLRITTDWMVDTILPETPSWIMGPLYVAVVLYTARGGLDVLARVNQFLLPVLTGLGILVSLGTAPAKDYGLLTPILEKGFGPVLAATALGLGYYGETSVLAMFNAYVRPQDRRKTLRAYSLALLFVVTTLTGPLAGSVATLGYRVAQNMAYPTFEHWLMISFVRFYERTDLLAVHQWLAGGYVRMGLYLLMAAHGLRQLAGGSRLPRLRILLPATGAAAILAAELLFRTKPVFDRFIQQAYLPAGAVLGIYLPPLLLAVAWLRGLARPVPGVGSHGA